MDHHSPLLVTDKGIRPYIEKLIYGVALFMPLEPLVGDILLWSAIVLSLYDQGVNISLNDLQGGCHVLW